MILEFLTSLDVTYVRENTSDEQNKSEKYTDVKTSRLQWFGQAVYVFYNTGALLLKDR